jgi:WD40 repeat protein
MSSLFISYSSVDRAVAERLIAELRAADFGAVFLDADPVDGIMPGRKWESEIYAALRRTSAVVFLLSDTSVVSQWCFAELALARSLGKPIYPVRISGSVRLDLLADLQEIDLRAEHGLPAGLSGELRRAGLREEEAFDWDPARSPYPGLEAFGPDDAAVFFGRRTETGQILDLLQPALSRGAGRWVCLLGPSGSGKSSLLHAGVLPRLVRQRNRWLVVPPFTPGGQPIRKLAAGLAAAYAGHRSEPDVDELERLLVTSGPQAMPAQLSRLSEAAGGARRILVVVDQLEELVTRAGNRERQAFVALLAESMHDDSPLWVISTMRSEFLSTAPERSGLFEVIDDPVVVEPLSRARLPEVVVRPAARVGLEFAPGLVERIVEDTTGGDALPLLAYTLHELAERADRVITVADYEALGGVVGALQRRADQLVADLTRREHGPLIMPTLLRLASVDEEGLPVRRRLAMSVFTTEERAIVQAFVDARLLTTSTDNGARPALDGDRGGEATVDVAHEALLRQWPPLRHAIEDSQESLRRRAELGREAGDWLTGDKDRSYLLRGDRLAVFEEWAAQNPGDVDPLEREYLQASRTAEAAEIQAVRRRNRWLLMLSTGLAVFLVIALIAGLAAVQGRQEARSQAGLALVRQLLAQAALVRDRQPDVGLLLAVEAVRRAGPTIADEARYALVDGLSRDFHVSTRLVEDSAVNWVEFSPDGGVLATADDDGTVALWRTGNGQPVGRLVVEPASPVRRLAFSPDGRTLAVLRRSDVRLWQLASSEVAGPPLVGHNGVVYDAVFSPDGSVLATGSADGTVRLWDAVSGAPLGRPLEGHAKGVFDITFSPDGRTLASTGWDATVRLWNVADGRSGPVLVGHTQPVAAVAFSPDGRTVVSGGSDSTVRIWDSADGVARHVLTGHRGTVSALAVSPDGARIASGGVDHEIRLWDTATGAATAPPLAGHTDVVMDLAFTPDGGTIVSGGNDGSMRIWDAAAGVARGTALTGHTSWINDVVVSPDGQLLASGSGDGTARVWRTAATTPLGRPLAEQAGQFGELAFDGHKLLAAARANGDVWLWDVASSASSGELVGHQGTVNAVAFAGDGTLASAGSDGTIRLWDPVARRAHRAPLTAAAAQVDVAFSRDSRTLAAAGADGVVRLWDVPSGASLGTLTGHQGVVQAVAFGPTGGLVSGGDDKTLRFWDLATRAAARPPLATDGAVLDVAFSPDGRTLASAGADAAVSFWDAESGSRSRDPITGFTSWVNGIAFSPDGATIASAADEGLQFWDVSSGRSRGRPLAGAVTTGGVVFVSDGFTVASADKNGVRSWDLHPEALMSTACRMANRNLSAAEWASFFGPQTEYTSTCP